MPKKPPVGTADRHDVSPIPLFAEMVYARDRGDFDRAAEAKDYLARLGWTFRYRKPPTPGPTASREGGAR